ncbi:translation initiation factor IF-3 [Candidatus Dependentiae bacterium]|nr:translation initiation factor IF-3 [Candidatus Dependentiae bacterium]
MKTKNDSLPLVNEDIRYDKLQVISNDGRNLGIMIRDQALKMAKSENLDLVILAESGNEGLPVAKIMDFGKMLYAKKKQQAEAKKHQKVIQVKEIKLRPKIGEHDYQTKMNQAIQFLKDGKHLKVTLMFRGREATGLEERGTEIFEKIAKTFEESGLNLTKLAQEKDAKTSQSWSRIYYLKK